MTVEQLVKLTPGSSVVEMGVPLPGMVDETLVFRLDKVNKRGVYTFTVFYFDLQIGVWAAKAQHLGDPKKEKIVWVSAGKKR